MNARHFDLDRPASYRCDDALADAAATVTEQDNLTGAQSAYVRGMTPLIPADDSAAGFQRRDEKQRCSHVI